VGQKLTHRGQPGRRKGRRAIAAITRRVPLVQTSKTAGSGQGPWGVARPGGSQGNHSASGPCGKSNLSWGRGKLGSAPSNVLPDRLTSSNLQMVSAACAAIGWAVLDPLALGVVVVRGVAFNTQRRLAPTPIGPWAGPGLFRSPTLFRFAACCLSLWQAGR